MRWHRELSRRRRRASRRPGRSPLDTEIKKLIVRLGRENPRWGYLRIRGELLKLGIDVSATTIATVLRQAGLGPAPRRIGPTWTQFLRLQAYGLLSPGASSEEENQEDLAPAREDLPAPGNGDPGKAEDDDPIHDGSSVSMAPPFAPAEARERASLRHLRQQAVARARDGPAMAA